ncbi:MAG: DUF4175 family protein, partial [bacterium]
LAAVVGLGWALRKFVLRPLLISFNDLSLALRIEERWPGLQDRLASAIEFLEMPKSAVSADNASPELRQHVINQAFAEVQSINFAEAIDPKPARESLKYLGIALGLALFSVVLGPQSARIAMARFFNPLSGPEWPKATQFVWLEAPAKVAIGEPWSLVVKVEDGYKVPSSAVAEFTFADGEKAEEPLRILDSGEFRGRIESVTQSFRVRVRGGDDLTDQKSIEAVTPPRLGDLVIEVQPPAYTGLPKATLAPGSAQVRAVEGSVVSVASKATKVLSAATLKFTDTGQKPPQIVLDAALRQLSVSWVAIGATGVAFDLTDSEGFTSKDQGRLDQQVIVDTAPRVVLEDPAADREITPQAVVPIRLDLEDDFGLAKVELKYVVSVSSGEAAAPVTRTLWAAAAGQPLMKKQKLEEKWDMTPMGLSPGSMITLTVEATDLKTPNGPNVGKSREIRLRVITPQEAARQLEDQRREIREETERVLAMQKQANRPVDDAKRTMAQTGGELNEPGKQELQNAEQIQRQVGDRINNPADGLGQRGERFMNDMQNLKLQNPEAAEQMKALQNSLAQLQRGPVPQAEQALNRANRALDNRAGAQQNQNNQPGAQQNQPNQPNQPGSQSQQAMNPQENQPGAQAQANNQPQGQNEQGKSQQGQQTAQSKSGQNEQGNSQQGQQTAQSKSGQNEQGKSQQGQQTAQSKSGQNEQGKSQQGQQTAQSKSGQNEQGKSQQGQQTAQSKSGQNEQGKSQQGQQTAQSKSGQNEQGKSQQGQQTAQSKSGQNEQGKSQQGQNQQGQNQQAQNQQQGDTG